MGDALQNDLASKLASGVETLGLSLSESQLQQLMNYMALIQKWNKVYNLTALRDPNEMLTHHLLDSLSAIGPLHRHLQNDPSTRGADSTLLDVGSGGGLPGVVIAICCSNVRVTCVDAVSKKAAFVQQVAASLKLPNLKGVHARVETLTEHFDVVCSRAFASLPDFVTWSAAALKDAGVWMAMKGRLPTEEMDALPIFAKVFHVEQLQVPGLDAERCMIWMKKAPSSLA
ncbi:MULTISPECIES: 16S rRNA (guanine(527)-N(7))-methyltransferase RsmG [unclassified Limnohabitans]|jgi:16S rRNA (guanine527-N7)-methyltransferase|uniref:16S rRNA (guanine(527)-N(7))-methyltransferase RsmG n=1 Tax=unclassified Limnohabitans TaxID=2626134 RepID=UPI0006DCA6D4|nr:MULTISPECIES: 16S rRNA (guanine(527)-N(7))-methyltransferase RsmG [unclassified Limnohabitans]ALK90721.1 Ribosomal RNA small subunit methyltransferase G [Limnohabitans sp. 103DPR2]MBU3721929.1 16S rRNA (guanine(527)-N(7))-methyltransferase RsmG [Limnohabitans sp.]PUE34580.1 16S rRNA methyltransferase G [Limnohabitans sp. Hippo4]